MNMRFLVKRWTTLALLFFLYLTAVPSIGAIVCPAAMAGETGSTPVTPKIVEQASDIAFMEVADGARRHFINAGKRVRVISKLNWVLIFLAGMTFLLRLLEVAAKKEKPGKLFWILFSATLLCASLNLLVSLYFDFMLGVTASLSSGGARMVALKNEAPFFFYIILVGKAAGAALLLMFASRCIARSSAN